MTIERVDNEQGSKTEPPDLLIRLSMSEGYGLLGSIQYIKGSPFVARFMEENSYLDELSKTISTGLNQ